MKLHLLSVRTRTEVLFLNLKPHRLVFNFLKMSVRFAPLTFRSGPSPLPNHSYLCIDCWPVTSSTFCCLSVREYLILCLLVSLTVTLLYFLKFGFQKVTLRFQTLISPASIESSWLHPSYYYARTHHQAPAWSSCMF